MRHNYIGTEHMLLALLREKDGVACFVLRELDLKLESTRAQVTDYLSMKLAPQAATAPASPASPAVAGVAPTRFVMAPAVRDLLELAMQCSRAHGGSKIETVHLLRALCRDESEGAHTLRAAGVDVGALRERLGA